jgi:hypothetical protein
MKLVIVILAFMTAGCTTPSFERADLFSATRLTIGSGELRRQLKGSELTEYLATFEPYTPSTFTLVHNTQKGTITIKGRRYPIEYREVKIAGRPAIITVINGEKKFSIKQPLPMRNDD